MSRLSFEVIFYYSPLPIYVVQDEYFIMVNPKMVEISGYSREELLNLPFIELVHPSDRMHVLNNVNLRIKGSKVPEEYQFKAVTRSGKVLHVKGVFKVVEVDERPAILGQVIDVTAQKKVEENLRASEARYRTILENIEDGYLEMDLGGYVTFFNNSLEKITGYSAAELKGKNYREFLDSVNAGILYWELEYITRTLKPRKIIDFEITGRDGQRRYVQASVSPVKDESNCCIGFRGVLRDVTERRRVEKELRFQQQYFKQVFQSCPVGISILDKEYKIIEVNEEFYNMFNYLPGEVKKQYLEDLVVPEYRQEEVLNINYNTLYEEKVIMETTRQEKHGTLINVLLIGYPIKLQGEVTGYCFIYKDITERKVSERQLEYLSTVDPLTGLYNRHYFEQYMFKLENGDNYRTVGLVICDIDGLKIINDSMGHSCGDEVLQEVAVVLQEEADGSTVARIGGDEFAVLVTDCEEVHIERMCKNIESRTDLHSNSKGGIPYSLALGWALSDKETFDRNDLFQRADDSMYRKKLHRQKSARSALTQGLMAMLEARDFITEGHTDRLQDMAEYIGKKFGLSEHNINELQLLARFHDIGKVGVSDNILFKKGPLTPGEWEEMKKHCEIGHRIAFSAPELAPVADWILKHHEWWNGEGYPLGLQKEEIPLECRILSILDAYDAMTSNRPYRRALSKETAINEIRKNAGKQFDPQVVDVFLEAIKKS